MNILTFECSFGKEYSTTGPLQNLHFFEEHRFQVTERLQLIGFFELLDFVAIDAKMVTLSIAVVSC